MNSARNRSRSRRRSWPDARLGTSSLTSGSGEPRSRSRRHDRAAPVGRRSATGRPRREGSPSSQTWPARRTSTRHQVPDRTRVRQWLFAEQVASARTDRRRAPPGASALPSASTDLRPRSRSVGLHVGTTLVNGGEKRGIAGSIRPRLHGRRLGVRRRSADPWGIGCPGRLGRAHLMCPRDLDRLGPMVPPDHFAGM